MSKSAKQLERYFKGAANHWRIKILLFLFRNEGATLDEISQEIDGNFKTISQHTRYLVQAGLLAKKHKSRQVRHFLSPYGKKFVKFMRSF